ncbi:MAG: transporter [Acidobacteriales bacterium]|nr:transporter [Terriglobales bacterium]
MKAPCEEAAILSHPAEAPCKANTGRWVLAATILGSSMAFIDTTVVNVALPSIQTELKASAVGVLWVVESYGLFLSALILVGGSLGDLYGRRRIFDIGVSIFAVASVASGFALDVRQLIIARAIQGIGAAMLVPSSLALISASFAENERGRAIGTWSGLTSITMAIGPVLGGWLIEHASWRWAFFINVPIAAAVLVITLWRVPESRGASATHKLDYGGAALATLGLGGLVYAFIMSAAKGWRDPLIEAAVIIGVLGIAALPSVERKSKEPMIPLGLFRSRTFVAANLVTFALYAALGVFFFVFPLDLIQIQGYSATAAGAATLPMILLVFIMSRWSGGLVSRVGPRLPLVVGPLLCAAGFALCSRPSVDANYWTAFLPAVLTLGLGLAVTVAPLTTTVMNSVPSDHAGAASGINNAVARVSGLLAVAILGAVMVAAFGHKLHQQIRKAAVSPDVVASIEANHTRLAAIPIPENLDPDSKASVKRVIQDSFIFGFRIVTLTCAGLAVLSAGIAWMFVRS